MNNIASHNTMSYLRPDKWYMRIFNFVAQCQNKTIEEQYNLGVRVFDIRIRFNEWGLPYFAHGFIKYKLRTPYVFKVFYYLNKQKDCKVRLILETTRFTKDIEQQKRHFLAFIAEIIQKYENIYFFEGVSKYKWEDVGSKLLFKPVLYKQYVGSMDRVWIYKIWPRLYAMKHNYQIIQNDDEDVIKFIDFVGNYYC